MAVRFLRQSIANLTHHLRVVLFNPVCRICGEPLAFYNEVIVCGECLAEVTPMKGPVCRRCGKELNDDAALCGDCLLRPPLFDRNLSFGLYGGALRELILLYKYGELQPLAGFLADCLMGMIENALDKNFDAIVTVPQDPGRKREFDHLAVMGKIIGRRTGIPYLRHALVKKKATDQQSKLPLKSRLRNLDGAFALKRPRRLAGKRILLIDDVFTTGTTVKRCSELLYPVEATVTVLTLARSV